MRLRLRQTGIHLGLAAAIAVPLYVLTPRSPAEKLSFGQPRVEIGFNADQMTDLSQTGELKSVDEVAFEVTAEENGRPKTNLPGDQRWLGRMLRDYAKGVWNAVGKPAPPGSRYLLQVAKPMDEAEPGTGGVHVHI